MICEESNDHLDLNKETLTHFLMYVVSSGRVSLGFVRFNTFVFHVNCFLYGFVADAS